MEICHNMTGENLRRGSLYRKEINFLLTVRDFTEEKLLITIKKAWPKPRFHSLCFGLIYSLENANHDQTGKKPKN